jgi:hypothetical protein
VKLILGLLILVIIVFCLLYFKDDIWGTSIGKIIQNPRDYDNKEVTISGIVKDRTSLVFVSYYTVQDKSGEIRVISKKAMPTVGSKIKIRGRVDEAFQLGDMQVLVIVEK